MAHDCPIAGDGHFCHVTDRGGSAKPFYHEVPLFLFIKYFVSKCFFVGGCSETIKYYHQTFTSVVHFFTAAQSHSLLFYLVGYNALPLPFISMLRPPHGWPAGALHTACCAPCSGPRCTVSTSSLSGTKCSRLVSYRPRASPGFSRFSEEPWLRLVGDA